MKFLDLTFGDPAEDLALDEALLDVCEEQNGPEILRLWNPRTYFVVAGYSNRVGTEANLRKCATDEIPVFRRCSGGGTVLQGPGCLNFSLLLNHNENPCLETITRANQFIMERHRTIAENLLSKKIQIEGHTDLAVNGLKFSGNAQRRKTRFLLFHGSFLLNFDIRKIEELLNMPTYQPAYRSNRSHGEFLTNISVRAADLKTRLRLAWNAEEILEPVPRIPPELIKKYKNPAWNLKF